MGNPQERSLGWLAGIIDGEGTVSFQVYTLPDGRIRVTPYVCVVNSDVGILDEAWRILNELTVESKDAKPRWCNHNRVKHASSFDSNLVCKVIRIDGRAVRLVLEPLVSHLKSKKREAAQAILKYLSLRDVGLLDRDEATGRITRKGYTHEQIDLVVSTRSHKRAKSSEAIRSAPNVVKKKR